MALPESESWVFDRLEMEVQVVRTEGNVPHVYAHNHRDLGFVLGFTTARDRYFMMDLIRRLGRGKVSELFGQDALEIDQESRGTGMTYVASQIEMGIEGELAEYVDAFTEGVNAYIEIVQSGLSTCDSEREDATLFCVVERPSELALAGAFLGSSDPTELMEPFDRGDVAAMIAVFAYNTGYETDDIGRTATVAALPELFEGAPFQDLRRAGALDDLYLQIAPIHAVPGAPGFAETTLRKGRLPKVSLPPAMKVVVERLARRMERRGSRLGRDREKGFGSNAWAVVGSETADGSTLLAGDGHLQLSVPALLYRFGVDTRVFGDGDMQMLGLTIPGLPLVAEGTNGRVAFAHTNLASDQTDWFTEEIELGSDGLPSCAVFRGACEPLIRTDEEFVVAEVEALDSPGRTEVWPRWETFDGRWIAEIEGEEPEETPAPGSGAVNMQGTYIIPKDMDGDGKISAISFDYTAFDGQHVAGAFEALTRADDVYEYMEAAKGLAGVTFNHAASDNLGNIVYGAFQPFPCRDHLPRDEDGEWVDGANPQLLIDGTQYGGWSIPYENGVLDESKNSDSDCVIPYLETPHAINPAQGYVVTANQDPGGMTFDNSVSNDSRYFGGPWDTGFRADTIARNLEKAIEDDTADIAKMSEIQGNTESRLGELLLDDMLEALDYAAALADTPTEPADQRIEATYQANAAQMNEVKERLTLWKERGFNTPSGVHTFYNTPTAQDREDAVATMIFNAWMSRVLQGVFDDEGLPGGVFRKGTHSRLGALRRFLDGRGEGNPEALSSFNDATGESVYFDVLSTPEVETSREVIVVALRDALTFLRSDPNEGRDPEDPAEPGTGGFATNDMSQWLWGLRHYTEFESLLSGFIEGEEFEAIFNTFSITTDKLPLESSDPRAEELLWFPRQGDNYAVDAANPGTSGVRFGHGSGPVMRMVVSLKGDRVDGVNVIPGGQSGLTSSNFFSDQARLWLANETTPMRFSVDQVIAYPEAVRERYAPVR